MPISHRIQKTVVRALLVLTGMSVLSGCFFVPPGQRGDRGGCWNCTDHGYHRDHRRGHEGDDD